MRAKQVVIPQQGSTSTQVIDAMKAAVLNGWIQRDSPIYQEGNLKSILHKNGISVLCFENSKLNVEVKVIVNPDGTIYHYYPDTSGAEGEAEFYFSEDKDIKDFRTQCADMQFRTLPGAYCAAHSCNQLPNVSRKDATKVNVTVKVESSNLTRVVAHTAPAVNSRDAEEIRRGLAKIFVTNPEKSSSSQDLQNLQILGFRVSPVTYNREIHTAFRNRVVHYRPTNAPAPEDYVRLTKAYESLLRKHLRVT